MVKNKKAWVKLVECFITITILSTVMLIIVSQKRMVDDNFSAQIYEEENEILRKIQLNDSLRNDVLGENTLPLEWENFPPSLKNIINLNIRGDLNCTSKICGINDPCLLDLGEKDIYVQSVLISSNLSVYSPKKLKLFCWKEYAQKEIL